MRENDSRISADKPQGKRVTDAAARHDGKEGAPIMGTTGDVALLLGLHFPPHRTGRPSVKDREAWLDAVAILMARGVTTAHGLSKLIGVNWEAAQNWISEVERRTAQELQNPELASVREELVRRVQAVSEVAWRDAMREPDPDVRNRFFKTILLANKRIAAICGSDSRKSSSAQERRAPSRRRRY